MVPVNSLRRRLLLVGAGHSQVEVLRQFARKPLNGVEVTLVSRARESLYSGMLPGLVAGHYLHEQCHIRLQPLAEAAGAAFMEGEVNALDVENNIIHCVDGRKLQYDLLAINTGSVPVTANTEETARTLKVKPVGAFVEQWSALFEQLMNADRPQDIAVIGAGAGGVELVLAMRYRLLQSGKAFPGNNQHQLHLFTDTATVLPAHHRGVQQRIGRILRERGINVHTGKQVTGFTSATLVCADNSIFDIDHVLWVTQAAAPSWISHSGLESDAHGFVQINACLQSVSHPRVFAAGDIASLTGKSLQKSGVVAVRQGPLLAENLRRASNGQSLKRFTPQKRYLALISCGDKYAVASRGVLNAEGRWLWYLKDWIDRRFIRRYNCFNKHQGTVSP